MRYDGWELSSAMTSVASYVSRPIHLLTGEPSGATAEEILETKDLHTHKRFETMRLIHSSQVWLALAAVALVAVEAQRECIKYLSSAEGLFKKPFYMKSHYQNSIITNVTLIERHSYYKCEPAEDKYGIDSSGKEWWVFRGCGGVFDIEECTEGGSLQLKVKEEIPVEQRDMEKKTMQEFGVLQREVTNF